jgi:hypothetical protein
MSTIIAPTPRFAVIYQQVANGPIAFAFCTDWVMSYYEYQARLKLAPQFASIVQMYHNYYKPA